jgi:zinc protease
VRQPSFQRTYLAPTYSTADEGTAEALDVLSHLLGTGSTSRFYRTLVVERALAANAAAFYSGSSLDYGRFGLFGSPRPETDLESLEEAIDAVIEALLTDGVTVEEVERAKSALIADAVFARDNQRFLAQAYGVGLTTGETVEEVTTYPDRVAKVTIEDVNRVAKEVFSNPAQVTAHLLPELAPEVAPEPEQDS